MGNARRLRQVLRTIGRHGLLDLAPDEARSKRRFRWLQRLAGPVAPDKAEQPLPGRLRAALEELGPIFIKFGQALSTRPDMLDAEMARELARLQDAVPPFEGARAILEARYGTTLEQIFSRFDDRPLAAASIAQVHAARLPPDDEWPEGREVVVKLLRPDAAARVEQDLGLLAMLADMAERLLPEVRAARPREIVADYRRTCHAELDLLAEAASGERLRRNSEAAGILHVPEIIWDLCHPDVVVMERVRGVPVSSVEELRRAGVDLKLLAERGVETFFSQVFHDNFFHADMHPGNVFVDFSRPEDPRWIAIDFGIMGELSARDQHYVARLLLSFFRQDFRRVALLLRDSGWVPADVNLTGLEAAVRVSCGPMVNMPLSEISFGDVLLTLLQTARRFEMRLQPQLVLLQKTLVNIEGLGRQIYPELDLWQTAQPFLERWILRQGGPAPLLRWAREELPLRLIEAGEARPIAALEQRRQLSLDRRRRRTLQIAAAIGVAGAAIGFAQTGIGNTGSWLLILASFLCYRIPSHVK